MTALVVCCGGGRFGHRHDADREAANCPSENSEENQNQCALCQRSFSTRHRIPSGNISGYRLQVFYFTVFRKLCRIVGNPGIG